MFSSRSTAAPGSVNASVAIGFGDRMFSAVGMGLPVRSKMKRSGYHESGHASRRYRRAAAVGRHPMRYFLPLSIIGALLALGVAAGAEAQAAAAALPSVTPLVLLDRVLRDYEQAWRALDPAALAMLFAEDGFVLANGRP